MREYQIYEGANGIQALDLMGRKTVRGNGELLEILKEEINEFIAEHKEIPEMQGGLSKLQALVDDLSAVTNDVISKAKESPNEIGAASYPYMELMGLTLFCFMWQRIIAAAQTARAESEGADDYLEGLLNSGEFFMNRLLPKSRALLAEIRAGADSLMSMTAEQF